MSTSKPSFSTFPPAAAILLIVAAIQYLVLEAITASAWTTPSYNYAVNFISDLGNPIPNDRFNGMVVNSPFHPLMNLAFVTQGFFFIAATLLVWHRISSRVRRVLLTLGLAHGVGIVLVGIFHENSTVPLVMKVPHFIGAWAAIFGGNLIAVIVGAFGGRFSAPRAYRMASLALGVVGIAAFAWLLADPVMMKTQGGLLERVAVYAIVFWQAMTGAALLIAKALQHRRLAARPTLLAAQ